MKLIVIRVRSGSPRRKAKLTLDSLGLKHVNHCTIVESSPAYKGMIQEAKDYITWGEADEKSVSLLLKRAKPIDPSKKLSVSAKDALSEKPLRQLGLRPTIRLHPPYRGLKSLKRLYPVGSLGNRGKEIHDLVRRMA